MPETGSVVLSFKWATLFQNRESVWLDRDWGKLRIWIIKKRLQGKPVMDICSKAQIDRKMFYRWWNRYQALGWSGLQEKPRGRPNGPEPDDLLKDRVIKLRRRYMSGDPKRSPAISPAKATPLTTTKPTESSVKQA
jgi:hypothetical protein